MRFHADLHVHSKYSRATSKHCDLEHLALWARRKGIAVVGTGDFTHPAWRAELKDKLVPAEPGLFRLRPDLEAGLARALPAACQGPARFLLSVEISTIYKKGELTRKIHHLIYVPSLEAAERLAARLGRVGNVASDGRPILGLDSRHLLELALEADPGAYLVPAHIWTPWFAVLGSRSGFDSVSECYGDLAQHIFAVETGLSSDPAMNWRVSALDRYRLVSNSDAHSPAKLGRETTLFDTALDYFAIRRALETGDGYLGTVEFFPEEGKYHLDGHRRCGVRLSPDETRAHDGRCPACGQPVTVGVMHRVDALADRAQDRARPPATAGAVCSLVPLPEILAEITGVGAASRVVARGYDRLLAGLGAELPILESVPLEDLARAESSLLAEAIARLRAGRVFREAGYDGEYGVIRLFEAGELRRRAAGALLFDLPRAQAAPQTPRGAQGSGPAPAPAARPEAETVARTPARAQPAAGEASGASGSPLLARLDPDQRAAAAAGPGALLIVAGPGAGKTRTLTHRIAHLVAERGVPAEACLAITFTRRAAEEMRARLADLIPGEGRRVAVHTFHSLGLSLLREHPGAAGVHRGFRIAGEAERLALLAEALGARTRTARTWLRAISRAKRGGRPPEGEPAGPFAAYQRALSLHDRVDLDDLVGLALRALSEDPGLAQLYRKRYSWIFVDEFQDLDEQQYALLRALAPQGANLCAIGDPNQAIFGFRGADATCFERFRAERPEAAVVHLRRNYRSSGTIVAASAQVIARTAGAAEIARVVRDMHQRITLHTALSERAEAVAVVHGIERLIGGHSFFSIDSGRAAGGRAGALSFADFAVLYRTDAQAPALCEALARSGLPFRKHGHAPLAEHPGVRALLAELDALEREAGPLGDSAPLEARLRAAARRLSAREDPPTAELEAVREQVLRIAAECADDRARLVEALALASEADAWDPRADRISLLTLHAAKGLEFPVVFIVGLEDGILPLRFGARGAAPQDEAQDEAEERRLLYVGMTRAQDHLILSRAARRTWRGAVRALAPSPFLADIEAELVRHSRSEPARRGAAHRQLDLF